MKKSIKSIIVIAFITIIAITLAINIRGNFLEYQELGENYTSVYTTNLVYRYIVMGANFIILFLIMYLCGRGIKKGLKVFFDEDKKEMPKLPNKSVALVVSAILSIFVANIFAPKILLAFNQASFVRTDGIFNFDISFFIFTMPIIKMLILYGIGICAALIVYSSFYYILVLNKYFDGVDRETLKNSLLIKNIIKYLKFIAINFSVYTLVRILDIVYDNFIKTNSELELIGAGTVDTTIKVVGNIILAIVIIVAVFLAAANFKKGNNSKILKNLLIIPGYMVIMFVAVFGFDLIFVKANQYDKEKQYIERNISYTKNAYGIDLNEETIDYTGTITEEEITNNKDIINNAVIISKKLALQNLNEDQTEKGYYTYRTAGIYKNENILSYLSPKEISNVGRTYNSRTYEYTHGNGVTLTSATSVAEDGGVEYERNRTLQATNILWNGNE